MYIYRHRGKADNFHSKISTMDQAQTQKHKTYHFPMGMKYFKDLNGKKDKEKRVTDQILWFHVTETNPINHKPIHGDDQVARS